MDVESHTWALPRLLLSAYTLDIYSDMSGKALGGYYGMGHRCGVIRKFRRGLPWTKICASSRIVILRAWRGGRDTDVSSDLSPDCGRPDIPSGDQKSRWACTLTVM